MLNKRILVDAPGQTCNRFWAYLDSVAWAIANKRKVTILFWDSSISYFDNLRKNPYVRFPFYSPKLFEFVEEKRVKEYVRKVFANRVLKKWFYKTAIAKKMGLLISWDLRKEHRFFPRLKEELKEIFRPNNHVCNDVEHVIRWYKDNNYFIIGVHIRRGDYKNFPKGKYYYDYDVYLNYMRQLATLYKDRKVAFFISSDEKYDKTLFSDFTICEITSSTVAHDLYALSLCDRIFGPLSTFSRWASWYGDIPLAFIERDGAELSDKSFSVVSDFYHFKNGVEIPNLTDKDINS